MRKLSRSWRIIVLSSVLVTLSATATATEDWKLLESCNCQQLVCVCDKAVLRQVYDSFVDAEVNRQKCEARVELVEDTCQLKVLDERSKCDEQLGQWFRKWYITIPVGAVVGAGAVLGLHIGGVF